MKAIILERKGAFAAALCEDGTIVKTRQAGAVGETVELEAQVTAFPAKRKKRWLRTAVAAVLALSLTGGAFGYLTTTASAYVSVDVDDASVELTVNPLGRVISVRPMSDDARELAEQLRGEVRYRKIEDALERTMTCLRGEPPPGGDRPPMIVGVASDSERRNAELMQFAQRFAEQSGGGFYIWDASRAERDRAMAQHLSVGRFAHEHRGPDALAPPPPPKP